MPNNVLKTQCRAYEEVREGNLQLHEMKVGDTFPALPTFSPGKSCFFLKI